jgi:hypothetical protein
VTVVPITGRPMATAAFNTATLGALERIILFQGMLEGSIVCLVTYWIRRYDQISGIDADHDVSWTTSLDLQGEWS